MAAPFKVRINNVWGLLTNDGVEKQPGKMLKSRIIYGISWKNSKSHKVCHIAFINGHDDRKCHNVLW
jgi:hypothetical protein